MAVKNSTGEEPKTKNGDGFRITNGPIMRLAEEEWVRRLGEGVELPHVQGAPPILFATARDPKTIFTYWEIDWPSIFAKTAPVDRQVHLRVMREDGDEEATAAVEPMAGIHYLNVLQPRGSYQVEIGYYQPEDVWNSVATSGQVSMPADRISDDEEVDVATIPFHLSFQRLIDMVRASNDDPLTEVVARLQKRATSDAEKSPLSAEEGELMRAMDLSLDELKSAQKRFDPAPDDSLRKRAEAILGFGSTSPASAFSTTSWSGGGS